MMVVRMDDNDPCRYWVTSEDQPSKEYIVDLCEHELGLCPVTGVVEFNGVCGLDRDCIAGCPDFYYRCRRELKRPENKGKMFRCKHIRAAEAYALKLLKPYMRAHRPNVHESLQT